MVSFLNMILLFITIEYHTFYSSPDHKCERRYSRLLLKYGCVGSLWCKSMVTFHVIFRTPLPCLQPSVLTKLPSWSTSLVPWPRGTST